jgi:hypothetical protein
MRIYGVIESARSISTSLLIHFTVKFHDYMYEGSTVSLLTD